MDDAKAGSPGAGGTDASGTDAGAAGAGGSGAGAASPGASGTDAGAMGAGGTDTSGTGGAGEPGVQGSVPGAPAGAGPLPKAPPLTEELLTGGPHGYLPPGSQPAGQQAYAAPGGSQPPAYQPVPPSGAYAPAGYQGFPPAAPPYGAAVGSPYAGAGGAVPPLSSPGRRLGQALLDAVLVVVTLFVGWAIWSLVIWQHGETPGMQILRMKVVKADTALPATWGTMALREIVGKFIIMSVVFGIFVPAALVLDCMLLWDGRKQELWDKVAGTVVVDNR